MPTKNEIREQAAQTLYQQHGEVTPALFLAAASNPAHPCHNDFDWNDATCAHNARLQRAYEIIKSIKFLAEVRTTNETPLQVVPIQAGLRSYVPSFSEVQSFLPRNRVLGVEESRWAFIQAKLRELAGWSRSVADIEELADLRAAIAQESGCVTRRQTPVVEQAV